MSLPSGNTVYPTALGHFLAGDIDLTSTTVVVYALDATYSYNPTDEFVADLGGSIAGGPITMASIDVTGGVVTSTPMTCLFPAASGGPWTALAIAQDTASPSTDLLLALIVRNADTTPVNVTTTGVDITYTFLLNLFFI